MSAPNRPVTLLIAALGGEGGGVLTDWIVQAAHNAGFPVQSTSIPGVAQRTGATTYYVEFVPATMRELNGRRPVLSLTPGVGDIDIMAATELLEAGRAIGNGFVTREKTFFVGSIGRSYLNVEKMAMGDGRYDRERLLQAVTDNSKETLLLDMEALAKKSGTIINSVMLGALAGSGRLPIPLEAFEQAIRQQGKLAAANLRGFRAGLEAARAKAPVNFPPEEKKRAKVTQNPTLADLEREVNDTAPQAARDIMPEGVRRLVAYQSPRYARLYLDRLGFLKDADAALLRETARHLAVRMSFEDVIRVAEAKIAPERFERIAREELKAKAGEPFVIHDFLKPGIEEMCQILPPFLARPILRVAARRGWLGKVYFGMEVNTTSVSGYLRFWVLAKLKAWRPMSHRYAEEQTNITQWLGLIRDAVTLSPELAREIAECARLIKGYGDTHARGSANYASIESRVIRPALAGAIPLATAIGGVASARAAALADPEGESLANCLAAMGGPSAMPVAAE
jgi:indolepyruvate ferredoxin oxidoreductase beta subunit